MRKLLGTLGVIMILEGVTGTLLQIMDRYVFVLRFFDHFNRFVVERVAFLSDYGVAANVVLAVLGLALLVARGAVPSDTGQSS